MLSRVDGADMGNKRNQKIIFLLRWLVVVISIAFAEHGYALTSPANGKSSTTADHSKFRVLQGPFERVEDVTAACLTCHTEASEQIRQTTHWTWLYEHEETGQVLGKSKVINSFCGMPITNEPRCTSCHVGYGWNDMREPPPQAEDAVDCLVCHDTTGDYWKFPTLAGYPTYIPREWPRAAAIWFNRRIWHVLPVMSVPAAAPIVEAAIFTAAVPMA